MDLDEGELGHFLGALPTLLRGKRALVVEGRDGSFDSIFYQWLCGEVDIEVVPLGGCHDVSAAAKRNLSMILRHCGLKV